MRKKKPVVAMLFLGSDWHKEHPFSNTLQRKCYEELYNIADKDYHVRMVRVCLSWFDGKQFTKYWEFKKGQWNKIHRSIQPDIVHDKTRISYEFLADIQRLEAYTTVINPVELQLITSDKIFVPLLFPDDVPQTIPVNNAQELQAAAKKIRTTRIVVKPRFGSGGKGIQIVLRSQTATVQVSVPSIVQEFIDTRAGVPNLYIGTHDFRVVLIDDTIIISYMRIPAPGKLLCNLQQNGKMILVPIAKIPKSILVIIKKIQNHFALFPHKLFMVDFFFNEKGKPKLIELSNGIDIYWPDEFATQRTAILHSYAEYFRSLVEEKQ
ncbi:MAG: ATP-grasp domain-containing protein [Candidatus Kerfeldbacteria bacterium]|nr:ATP-grasp domain-containing protein [Candidatus Kerfeldbacteria bacterium]